MAIASKPTTANVFGTASADDYLLGTAADDTLTGGVATIVYTQNVAGIDIMQGGFGNDNYIVDNASDLISELAYQGTDTIYTTVSYTLPSNVENIAAVQPTGTSGIVITGNSADNWLDSGTHNNISDTLRGFAGNDTYFIDPNDNVIEGNIVTVTTGTTDYTDSGGVDTLVVSSNAAATPTLTVDISPLITAAGQQSTGTDKIKGAAYLENVMLTDGYSANIIGNSKDNVLTGNIALNSLVAGVGNDTLDGGVVSLNTVVNALIAAPTYASLPFSLSVNATTGMTLTWKTASVVSSAATLKLPDNSVLTASKTTVGSASLAEVEQINLSSFSQVGAYTLTQGGVSAVINVGFNDTLDGGLGNDVYIVSNSANRVIELANSGTDKVNSSASFSLDNALVTSALPSGATLTHLVSAITSDADYASQPFTVAANGTTGIKLTWKTVGSVGNLAQLTLPADATGIVTTLTATRTTTGSATATEAETFTLSKINSGAYTLAARYNNNIEDLTLTGSASINGTGNFLANKLNGNNAANTLLGLDGTDSINALAGNDSIDAGTGNDTITGGAGKDTVSTGTGNDVVKFAAGTTDTFATATSVAGVDWYKDLVLNGTSADKLDITTPVAHVGAVNTGTISEASFITNMNTLLTAAGKGFIQNIGSIDAAVVSANAGTLQGKTYLAVDINGSDSFDASDFIIDITGSTVTSLLPTTFINLNLSLFGTAGNDVLNGQAGNDTITGNAGRDIISTGGGKDVVRFSAGITDSYALSSSLIGVDLCKDLVLSSSLTDRIDLTVVVTHLAPSLTGALNERTFIDSMNALLSSSGKGFAHQAGGIDALVVTATTGDLSKVGGEVADRSFIAVDLDASGTFTSTDFVIEITGSNFTGITAGSFM